MDHADDRRDQGKSRVDRKLADLAKTRPSAADLTGRVSGTSEETASFFNSERRPLPQNASDRTTNTE